MLTRFPPFSPLLPSPLGGCASNCNHRGYCDMGSAPPACLCFSGFGGLECELLVDSPNESEETFDESNEFDGADGEGEADATGAAGNTTAHGRKGHSGRRNHTKSGSGNGGKKKKNGSSKHGGKASGISNGMRPVDRSICNPPCDPVNGICWSGGCACLDGFTGPTCSDHLCPDDCSSRGKCNRRTGECECYKPYIGRTCSRASELVIPREVDTLDDVVGGRGTNSTNHTQNVLNPLKIGLSDVFHLIEENSKMQEVTEYKP